MPLLVLAVLLLSSLLMAVSPAANAQAVTSVEIGSGTLDRDKAAGPRRERFGFDPLTTGTHVVRVTWDGDADIRFSLFEASATSPFARPSDSVNGAWTGTLDGAGQYALTIWAVSGSADFTATIEASTTGLQITTQPADLTVTDGDDAVFFVIAGGDDGTTLAYQWFADGTAIPGAIDDVLTVSPASLADDGTRYSAEISDGNGGTLTSDSATLTVQATPPGLEITTQPADLTVADGDDAVFFVIASGSGTLAYQWLSSTTDTAGGNANTVTVGPATEIPGATSDVLTISPGTLADDGTRYFVEISDGNGATLVSDSATLSVEAAPPGLEITTQPADLTVTDGDDAIFFVIASGNGALDYQWFADGTAVSGATDDVLTISPGTLADSGTVYRVDVIDGNGATLASDSATLTVEAAAITVSITTQPMDTTVIEGEDAGFSVAATGSGTLDYQWFANGAAIVGATTDTLLLSTVSSGQDGDVYRVEITDDSGTIGSNDAILTVDGVPGPVDIVSIGQGTVDRDGNAGPRRVRLDFGSLAATLHTVSVSWDGDADIRFRVFESNGSAISPVMKGSSPSVWSGELAANEQYYIGLWSRSGVANYSATVEANVSLSLARQPSDLTVTEGEDATFTVEASGSGTLVYQWFADGSPLSGETGDTLTVFSASLADDGVEYTVEVGNGVDTVTSDAATLTVDEPLVVGLFSEEADTSTWMLAGPAPTLDFKAGPNTDGWGRVLLRVGDVLLVGGDFTGIKPSRGGQVTDRPFLAALDAVSGQPVSTFQVPSEVDSVVRALAHSPSGDRVYVGGDFGLLTLDAVTGALDFAVDVVEGSDEGRVFDIALSQSQVYIGGDFNRVDGTFRANIARLSLDGDLDSSWTPKVVNGFENGRAAPVQSITLSPAGDVVYVGGNFGRIDSTPVDRTPHDKGISMLALEASDGAVRPERFIPNVGGNTKAPAVHDIAVTEFYVIIAWGGPNILTFHALSGEQLRQYDAKGDVQALQVVGDHVFVGHHGEYFGSSRNPIPPEAVESISPRILVPYKFHSFRIDDGSFEVEQAWKISGTFGVWGIAVGEDSIWVAGQMFRAGLNDRAIDGLVRFPAQD